MINRIINYRIPNLLKKKIVFDNPMHMDLTFTNPIVNQSFQLTLLRSALIFTIFIPYIPSLIGGTDTQPTFMLLLMALAILLFLNKKLPGQFNFDNRILAVSVILIFLLVFAVVGNKLLGVGVIFTRVFSFIQFTSAVLFGLTFKDTITEKELRTYLWIYFVFTFIFFLSGGLIEDFLIRSRTQTTEELMNTGRGAKTLSPEPSMFALQIFNILTIYIIAFTHRDKEIDNRILGLVSFCLLASFSGYGLLILSVLLFLRFIKLAIGGLLLLLISAPYLASYLESQGIGIRAFTILIGMLKNGFFLTLIKDGSVGSRIASFQAYIQRFQEYWLWGDGFSLFQNSGFVSIPASIGFIGLILVVILFYKILIMSNVRTKYKFLVILWFTINTISGTIAIPAIGVTIGLIIRNGLFNKKQLLTKN